MYGVGVGGSCSIGGTLATPTAGLMPNLAALHVVNTFAYMHNIYIYIYTCIERERDLSVYLSLSLSIDIYIYIYIHIYIYIYAYM